jgi:N-acetylglucosamine malate deacetylase 1
MTVLAVGAHPDDVEFGCGGVLLVEAARGAEISLCVCSRGEAGSNGTPAEREAEARRAAELLGAQLSFLDFGGDCHIEATVANAIAIARLIREAKPQLLLAPVTSTDQHPDHTAVGVICRNAARLARYGGVEELRGLGAWAVDHLLGYAVTPGAEPRGGIRLRVDISSQFERWVQLMECHQTQLRTRRYVDLQVARARTLGIEAGVEYAQALFPADDFLVDSLAALPRSVRMF